jgi:hypothetical protein
MRYQERVPCMIEPAKFLAALLDDWYPSDYILAVIDDLAEAEQACQDLHLAGWDARDIRLFRGRDVAGQLSARQKRLSLAGRLKFAMRTTSSYESILDEDYALEAWRGHQILAIYTPEPEEVEQVRRLLVAHHAHDIEHFGGVVITGLPHEAYALPS